MTRSTLMCACAVAALAASPALAQTGTPAGVEEESVTKTETSELSGSDILTYTPDFFESSNPETALDMVERLPGFSIEEGADVRGFAGSAGNLLIDGNRPASKSDDAISVLGRTPAGRVARIDIIRGGAAGIDMQGYSVVANVVLKDGPSSQHTVTGQAFLFEGGPELYGGAYEYSASRGERSWGAELGRSISYTDSSGPGILRRVGPDGGLLLTESLERSFDAGGWNGAGNYSGPLGTGSIELNASAYDNFFDDGQVFVSGSGERIFVSESSDTGGSLGARYERPLSEKLSLNARLIQSLGWSDGVSTSEAEGRTQRFVYDNQSGESIARGELRWERSGDLTIETSAEGAYNFLDAEQNFFVNGEAVPLPNATVKVEELRGELAGKAIWKRGENLTLEAGARLEQSRISQSGAGTDTERSFFYPKPRLAATWTPAENHQIRLRFERELGQLDFNDFAASSTLSDDQVFGGNIDLEPEQRWISEAVYERRFWDEGALTLTYRHDEIVDVIDIIPLDDGLSAVGNIGGGSLDRFQADLRLPTDRIGIANGRIDLTARYDHTRVTDPTTGEQRQISGVRPLTGEVEFEQDIPKYDLTWGVFYMPYYRETSFTPDQETFFEVNQYVNVFGEYTISPGTTVRVAVTVWNDFLVGRDVYASRNPRTLAFEERREIDPREFIQFRLRKTF